MSTNSPEYNRQWYAANADAHKARVAARKELLKQWFQDYKMTLSCSCGESTPCCLDFHHRDSKTKIMNVGVAVDRGWSKGRILEEISKCEVLCANCHRKITHNASIVEMANTLVS